MKKLLTIVLCAALAVLAGCTGKDAVVDYQKLEERDKLTHFKGKPFTGVAVRKYGQKKQETTYMDGKMHGLWTWWHPNGLKEAEGTYMDGKKHGQETWWHPNGLKQYERTYEDGKMISQEYWAEDSNPLGQDQGDEAPNPLTEAPKVVVDIDQLQVQDGLTVRLRYFEGKPFTGVAVGKYPNGQKKTEATFKDGKRHGLWTEWFEDGQKKWEETYKDGKFVTPP